MQYRHLDSDWRYVWSRVWTQRLVLCHKTRANKNNETDPTHVIGPQLQLKLDFSVSFFEDFDK